MVAPRETASSINPLMRSKWRSLMTDVYYGFASISGNASRHEAKTSSTNPVSAASGTNT